MIAVPGESELVAVLSGGASPETSPTGLIPRGSGSRLGALPVSAPVLDLSAFSQLETIDRDDMVLTAGAATPIDTAASAAAELGLILCPLIPQGTEGTLGGLHASGEESPAAPTEGRVRDAVLGIEGRLGDGSPLRSGGRVVKNVTGYDLSRLLSGSRGTLAVITRLHWRLRRLPPGWIEVSVTRPASEVEALIVAARRGPEPTATRIDLEAGQATARFLVEGSGSAATARSAAIVTAIGADAAIRPRPIEALAAWLAPGDGDPEHHSARGWSTRLTALGAVARARARVFPFVGNGTVESPSGTPPRPAEADPYLTRLRTAWDPQERLWDGSLSP